MVKGGGNGVQQERDPPIPSGHVLYERPAGTDFVREWLDATTTGGPRPTAPAVPGGQPAVPDERQSDAAAVNLLCVSTSVTVDEWVALVRGLEGVGSAGLVSVGDGVRSTAAQSTTTASTEPTNAGGGIAFTTVGDSGDLASVGLAVEAFVNDWHDSDARTVVCLDALTAFFERREDVRVLRFVAALLAQLEHQGVAAHAVVVPDAVDAWTRSALASLFETIDRGERDDAYPHR